MIGSIVTAIYRSEVASTLRAPLPADIAETARDTIGAAVAIAGQLPDALGNELLDSVRAAFALAFDAVASISAMLAIGVAILAIALLRPAAALAARRTTP